MSLENYEDIDNSDNEIHQIEVSHGSTSNQTSIYASSVDVPQSLCTFCCDVFILLLVLTFFVITFLFCFNQVPQTTKYFRNHPTEKISITVASAFITIILSAVFIIRCVRRCNCNHRSIAIWFRCKRRIPSDANIFENEEESNDGPTEVKHSTRKSVVCGDVKLRELSEKDLKKIRKILTAFINYHDDSDWKFSPYSHGIFTQRLSFQEYTSSVKNTPASVTKCAIKIVLVGSTNVGKTSIFHRILYNHFTEYYMATLGADLGHTTLHIFPLDVNKHLEISIQLWDIAGSERFSDLAHIVYKDASSFIVVCDATSTYSTSVLSAWVKDIQESIFLPHISLFYNKIDLVQSITLGQTTNDDLKGLDKYSVSAKTGEKVLQNLKEAITRSILSEIDKLL